MNPSLELIIGPMFSGKTSELIRQLVTYSKANFKVFYINSNLDSRGEELFSTHNTSLSSKQSIPMIKTKKLMEIIETVKDADIVGLDEAQFFDDLTDFYKIIVEKYRKSLIVCGLNGTSNRETFGQINSLIPYCDNIRFLHSFCTICASEKHISPASFSKRIVKTSETVCIGGIESYIPVCRHHFDTE
jgi:thymidine kinase